MVMSSTPALLACIHEDLMKLRVAYTYMVQNAPNEEARRIVEMNLMTVNMTMEAVDALYRTIAGDVMPPCNSLMDVPVFVDFMEAARYAFLTETQLIQRANDLHGMVEACHHMAVFRIIVAHQLNAMRLLYLDMF